MITRTFRGFAGRYVARSQPFRISNGWKVGQMVAARAFGVKRKLKDDPAATGGDSVPTGREAALAAALKQIQARFGKEAVIQLGQKTRFDPEMVISTGSLTVDRALGIGGLPKGRIIEIFGPESSGKTTLALQVIAQAQKQGLKCLFIDVEHAMDATYAGELGVNVGDLLLAQPASGEEALESADIFVRSGSIDVIVVDSVAALIPKKEIEGDMGDANIAMQARLMSQSLRKLLSSMHHSKTCMLIFLNQLRSKVGVMFGSPEVTSGGNALKFYASVRLDIRRIGQLKSGEKIVGYRTRVKVVKNKVAPPFREAEFDMTFGKGSDKLGELVDLGAELGMLTKAGSWYSLSSTGDRIGQGKEATKAYLMSHPAVMDGLEREVRAAIAAGSVEAPKAEYDVDPEAVEEKLFELDEKPVEDG